MSALFTAGIRLADMAVRSTVRLQKTSVAKHYFIGTEVF
jgi:hypothetical protein